MKRFLLRIQTYLRKLAGIPVPDEMPMPQSDIEKSLYEICKNNPNGIRPGIEPAGSISITENGTYDVAQFAKAEVQVATGGGEIIKAEGDFTLLSDGPSPVLEHNLGTQKIGVLIYPTGKITANAGYHNYYALFINANAIIGEQTWTLDASSYNSHFSGESSVTLPNVSLREGVVHQSPWPTQKNWFEAGNPPAIDYHSHTDPNVVMTDNTVQVKGTSGQRGWASGAYHWIVWKLG